MIEITDELLVGEFSKIVDKINIAFLTNNEKEDIKNKFEEFAKASKFDDKLKKSIEIYINENFRKLLIEPLKSSNPIFKKLAEYIQENIKYIVMGLKEVQKRNMEVKKIARDNMVHQLRVFLLGCYIMHGREDFFVDYFTEDITEFIKHQDTEYEEIGMGFEQIFAIWGLCSLFHDMGKIHESFYNLLSIANGIYEQIGKVHGFQDSILSLVESHLLDKDIIKSKLEILKKFIENFKIPYTIKKEELIKNSMKHNIFSAILILPISQLNQNWIDLARRMPDFAIFYYIILSILLHDNKKYYAINALSQFLIFVDSLQEWDRATKLYDPRFIVYTDRVFLNIEKAKYGRYERITLDALVDHKFLNAEFVRNQKGKIQGIDVCIKTLFEFSTEPFEKFNKWDTKPDKNIFNNGLKNTVEKAKKFLRLKIKLKFKNSENKVLFVCGFCEHFWYINIPKFTECSNCKI